MRAFRWKPLATITLIAIGLGGATKVDDPTGTWKWSYQRSNGETIDITLRLKLEGDKLTGTIAGPTGLERHIENGFYKEGQVSFESSRRSNYEWILTKFQGKLDGDTINGSLETGPADGEKKTAKWEAKRKNE